MMRRSSGTKLNNPLTLLVLTALWTLGLPAVVSADDWPQWLGPRRDGVWRETGILDKLPQGGPKVRWRKPVAAGYSGPSVADGRVYVTDWVLAEGNTAPKSGFSKQPLVGKERVLCLNEADGKELWKHEYDCKYEVSYPAGPRASPLIHGGKVYTIGTMGNLFCLDAAKGTVIWSKDFVKDYDATIPVWGCSASPLLDGDKLICIVGGPDSIAVAFH